MSVGVVAGAPRVVTLDVLRGFALAGILVINIGVFSAAPGGPPDFFSDVSVADRVLQNVLLLLVESKFFSLFSLLFGVSFAVQLERAAAAGAAFGPRWTRRLLALLGFGVAHVVLLWDGDILAIYACVGALLLLLRDRPQRSLLRWAAWLLGVPLILYLLLVLGLAVARLVPGAAEALRELDATLTSSLGGLTGEQKELLRTGSYLDIARARVIDYLSVLPLLVSRVPTVLGMFVLGTWAWRSGVLRDVERHRAGLRRVCGWCLIVGGAVQALIVLATMVLPPLNALSLLFLDQALTGPVLAVGYASGLVLLLRHPWWARALGWLRYPGRMALTVYLSQSLVLSLVFWSWGLGLVGQVSTAQGLAMAALVFAAQAVACRWWLTVFNYGPLEWLWRCLTYWELVRLRRRPDPVGVDETPAATPSS